jgi:hypothetical protein
MPHIIHRPSVFYDKNRYPLRLIIDNEQGDAEKKRDGIYDKKGNVKMLFVTGLFLVICYV